MYWIMHSNWHVIIVSLVFFIIGLLIALAQYLIMGIWFQVKDLHHETFIMSSFGVGIGVLIGSVFRGKNH